MNTQPAAIAAVDIELLYLDLNTCTRCRKTDGNLKVAIVEVREELEAQGLTVRVAHRHVTSEAEALALGLEISPTIRVNGRDIQLDWHANTCGGCTELAGGEEEVACRTWHWQGQEHYAAPVDMIVAAIRRAVIEPSTEGARQTSGSLSEPLRRFFAGAKRGGSCCG